MVLKDRPLRRPRPQHYNGLRGIAAVNVMLFHYLPDRIFPDLLATLQIPLFFLLSGFSLALCYGNTPQYQGGCSVPCRPSDIKWHIKFYQSRLARLGPLYYISNMAALIIHHNFIGGFLRQDWNFWLKMTFTLTMTNTRFNAHGLFLPFNSGSWINLVN